MIRVRYSENPLFRMSTIPTNSKPDPNPKLTPNVSTMVRICTMDFRNSGPSEWWAGACKNTLIELKLQLQ